VQVFFLNYVDACYVFEIMDKVPWMTTEWECNACLSIVRHLFTQLTIEMFVYDLRDIFFLFYFNGVSGGS